MSGKHHKPPWWRRLRTSGNQPCRPRRFLTELVEGATGCAHLVTSEDFEQGMSQRTGFYQVLCGRRIAAAGMTAPPSRYCNSCRVLETLR